MAGGLNGRSVAVLATDEFAQVELTEPVKALKEAGAKVEVVSPKSGEIQGFKHHDKGDKVKVDTALSSADAARYDALVLPGGVINSDALRLKQKAIAFIRHFVEAKKPIAAICHGTWTLINAGGVKGKKMTSWPSLEVDLRNAGATWVDEPAGRRVCATLPSHYRRPKFNAKMIEEIRDGRHDHSHRSAA
jgi:protease I